MQRITAVLLIEISKAVWLMSTKARNKSKQFPPEAFSE